MADRTSGPDSGGADLPGYIGNVGGTLLGLSTATKTATRYPEFAELNRQRQALKAKGFNDQPVGWLAGSDSGKAVYGPSGGAAGAFGDLGGLGF